MGDLFLDIDNTIFHVLLKEGVGEKYFAGDIFIIILQFYQFSIFFSLLLVLLLVFFFFFFPPGGVGFIGFIEKFNYL